MQHGKTCFSIQNFPQRPLYTCHRLPVIQRIYINIPPPEPSPNLRPPAASNLVSFPPPTPPISFNAHNSSFQTLPSFDSHIPPHLTLTLSPTLSKLPLYSYPPSFSPLPHHHHIPTLFSTTTPPSRSPNPPLRRRNSRSIMRGRVEMLCG